VLGHRSRLATAALVAVFGLLPVACGGDDGEAADEDDPASTAPAEESSTTVDATTTVPSVEAEVEAAYLAYWEMAERLAQAPDPNDPEIDERSTGRLRSELVDNLTTMRTQGQRIEFGPSNGHEVVNVDIDGTAATVSDCVVDEGVQIDDATGESVDFPATPGLLEATMVNSEGGWIVESISKPPAALVEETCGR
jgi:hypothetical protein